MALLLVLQAYNCLAGLAGAALAACFLLPALHQHVPPLYQIALRSSTAESLHKIGIDTQLLGASGGALRALAWLHGLNALIRLHAGIWTREKTGAACCTCCLDSVKLYLRSGCT